MKKIIILVLSVFLIFFLIGVFISKSATSYRSFTINNTVFTTSTTTGSNIIKDLQNNTIISVAMEFQKKIEQNITQMTQNLTSDNTKTIFQYREELSRVAQKFNFSNDLQKVQPDLFIKLSKELSQIKPPPVFYSFHLDLIKTYYSIGVALKEIAETKDLNEKILLYNYLKSIAGQLKF